MNSLVAIARTGVRSMFFAPARSIVTVLAVIAILVPFVIAMGITEGLRSEITTSVDSGADLYISGQRYGRFSPLPESISDSIRELPGVDRVVPRVVGHLSIGQDRVNAVVVGLPRSEFPKDIECLEGSLGDSGGGNQLVVGSDLARRLHLKVGDVIPPFYRNRQGERTSTVVGVFRSDVSIWQSRLIFADLATATRIFDQPDLITDALIYCRSGYVEAVRSQIQANFKERLEADGTRISTVARDQLRAQLLGSVQQTQGRFAFFWVLAIAVGIGIVLITSGMGMRQRRREIATLKLLGWRTEQILWQKFVESTMLVILAASLAVIIAYVWLRWANGYYIASLFLSGASVQPAFRVPFHLMPVPVLLSFVLSFVMVMVGTLYSTWRAAVAEPGQLLR